MFNYSYFDYVKDATTRDVIPVGKDFAIAGLGGMGAFAGGTLCSTGMGCIIGGPMAVFGAGNMYEGGSGLYNHMMLGEPGNTNPVKDAFALIPGGYGPMVYSGADLLLSGGAGAVKVPMKMGVIDGLKAESMFGVKVSGMDNNFFLPVLGTRTPYGTAFAIYLNGVSGKAVDFYDEATRDKK